PSLGPQKQKWWLLAARFGYFSVVFGAPTWAGVYQTKMARRGEGFGRAGELGGGGKQKRGEKKRARVAENQWAETRLDVLTVAAR
ncbi:hypothetical protein DNR41_27465, partial [Escherichia coli]